MVTRNDHGREVVYLVQPEQRIAAAYHRNGILHFFVVPAIVDLASSDEAGTADDRLHDDALALRDLFKFEFFFAEKGEFLAEVDAEVGERPIDRSPRRSSARSSRRTGRPPRPSPRTATRRSTPTSSPARRAGWPSSSCCRRASTAPTRCRAPTSTARSASPTTGACSSAGTLDGPGLANGGREFAHELHAWCAASAPPRRAPQPGSWS